MFRLLFNRLRERGRGILQCWTVSVTFLPLLGHLTTGADFLLWVLDLVFVLHPSCSSIDSAFEQFWALLFLVAVCLLPGPVTDFCISIMS